MNARPKQLVVQQFQVIRSHSHTVAAEDYLNLKKHALWSYETSRTAGTTIQQRFFSNNGVRISNPISDFLKMFKFLSRALR